MPITRRRFGRVRELPSGRWQARYQGPDGLTAPAPETFADEDRRRGLARPSRKPKSGRRLDRPRGAESPAHASTRPPGSRNGGPAAQDSPLRNSTGACSRAIFGPTFGRDGSPRSRRPCTPLAQGTAHDWSKQHPFTATAKAYRLLKADHEYRRRRRAASAATHAASRAPDKSTHRAARPHDRPGLRCSPTPAPSGTAPWLLLATFGSLRWGELARAAPRTSTWMPATVRVNGNSTAEIHGGRLVFAGRPQSRAGPARCRSPSVIVRRTVRLAPGSLRRSPGDDGLGLHQPNGPARCATPTSAAVYWLPALKAGPGWPSSTSMISGIPATPWRPTPGRPSGS